MIVGIILFSADFFFLTFDTQSIWEEIWVGNDFGRGTFDVEANANHTCSWYLRKGDITEIYFNVSGGTEGVKFYVRNPSKVIIFGNETETVNSMHGKSYPASDSGRYDHIFQNPDNDTAVSIYMDLRSPHWLRPTGNYELGYLIMLVSPVIIFCGICGFWSVHYDKNMERLGSELQTPLDLDFKGFIASSRLTTWIGAQIGRIFPEYWMKCILFGMILYILGGFSAVASKTLVPNPANNLKTAFYSDYYFLTISIVTGLTFLFTKRALKGLGDKLVYIDQNLNDRSDTTESRKLMNEVVRCTESETWLNHSRLCYYALLIGFSLIGLLVGWLTVKGISSSWIEFQYPTGKVFILCCVVIGLTVGHLIFISLRGIAILDRYCQDHVLPKGTRASDSGKSDDQKELSLNRLKQVGQFSFDLDFAAAVPSIAFAASYLQGTRITGFVSLICLSIYTFVLIAIFFLPLRPIHAKMVKAKEDALVKVNQQFRTVYALYANGRARDPPREVVGKLRDIYDIHERISRSPVWPIEQSIDLKIIATIFLPIALSVFSNFLSKLLGIP